MRRKKLLSALLFVVLLVVLAGCCTPQLVTWVMTPGGEFDDAKVPPAPDYANPDAWLALPSRTDEADVSLPELPAARDPQVDVFYLHPTSSIAARWNAPWNEPETRGASIRGGTLIQGSTFNGCCAVFAPAYRQATGMAYTTGSAAGDRAIAVAYSDVEAAFAEFRRRVGDRPFILAGHSQGSVLAARLLRERIAAGPLRERLVAAYLVGAALTAQHLGGVSACTTREETGCVITFNARGPGHEPDAFELDPGVPEKERLCVNPTLGAVSSEMVPRSRHGGAVFFDAEHPALTPAFAASVCSQGRLVVSDMHPLPDRGAMSSILLRVMGGENFHPVEYQLFYADLREDARRRATAFVSSHPPRQ